VNKPCQQKCFFAHGAFALQIRQNLGCNLFAGYPIDCLTFMQKVAMPFRRFRPTLFCLILAEACLLTERENIFCPSKNNPTKRSDLINAIENKQL
jgi:hypothetical protein